MDHSRVFIPLVVGLKEAVSKLIFHYDCDILVIASQTESSC